MLARELELLETVSAIYEAGIHPDGWETALL